MHNVEPRPTWDRGQRGTAVLLRKPGDQLLDIRLADAARFIDESAEAGVGGTTLRLNNSAICARSPSLSRRIGPSFLSST
jgi:hypothetical protein